MESVNIPSETVPAEMKACEQILKRAKELKKPEPVVAYWCESTFRLPPLCSSLRARKATKDTVTAYE